MFRFLVVWGVGVERNGIDVGPRARHCGTALRMLLMLLARHRIDLGTLLEQGAVQAQMTLGWAHKADGAVTVLVVVPVRQLCDPTPRGQQAFKPANRHLRKVFQTSEGRFEIEVVVTDRRAAVGAGHTQARCHSAVYG